MQQLKGTKNELGLESDGKDKLLQKFKERAVQLDMPIAVRKAFDEELNKLASLEPSTSEANATRTYLEWITQLPWSVYTPTRYNVEAARQVLEEDHYGLKELKNRILEFVAMGKLRGSLESSAPPTTATDSPAVSSDSQSDPADGVSKTSVGKSLARAVGREFFQFSVGGLGDVAEIKGHRRTYVGALPGKIVQSTRNTVGTSNPLVLIDGIDKGNHSDPSSALLEMLDPEQNKEFLDHYLDLPIDQSRVLFVCTANNLSTIPAPLLDRMEVLEVSGYVSEEKRVIAERYLVPQAKTSSGLQDADVVLERSAIDFMVEKIYCKTALKIVEDLGVDRLPEPALPVDAAASAAPNPERDQKTHPTTTQKRTPLIIPSSVHVRITADYLKDYVGPLVYQKDGMYEGPGRLIKGVSTGLGYLGNGSGAVMLIETPAPSPKLGEVIYESAQIALSWVKAHAYDLRHVLPVGGLKEKILVAHRAGIKTILAPAANRADIEENVPDSVKEGIRLVYVEDVREVLREVLGGAGIEGEGKGREGISRRRRRSVRVSKRCHDSFDSFLYRDVGNKALPTLALSKKSRLPFTGTHPASYVKKLSVSPIHKLSATVFQKQMVSAMKNIALHAANGAIQSFTFCSNFSLPEAFGGNVPHALRLLEELVLNCPFPVKNTRLSLSLANSLCGPSLIALDLKFCYPLQSPPDYSTIAKLIKQLPTSSPGLKRLSLQIGYSRHRPDTFAKVLSDSTFTFPFLREFGLEVNDVYGKLSDSLTAFFQHHPMIEVLKYRVHTSTSSARPLATPGIFRKLRHLESFAEDGILLCNLGTCWLEYLALDFHLSRPQSERYLQVRDALSKTASIRQLNLRKQDGYNLDNVSSIISACPNLTHLECRLDLVSSKRCPTRSHACISSEYKPHLQHYSGDASTLSISPAKCANLAELEPIF
ncbi:hypothetical protein BT96DRAFT_995521 [Gymnopus androsaceus JB14]|uniref:endopeptidase La n=1 Tax=Gymnopus androsaceus JB14 TaxID=1447944 RepID=A0A6A4HKV5_9AGAR|nr:hypothetical protein BT96DRAFT_995521 [Gymnopus androsaceus JB14]